MTGSEYGDKILNELEKKGQMVARAIAFATKAHEGQFRKGTKRPYIVHPLEVGEIVATLTFDEEIISAALLHDTIEDCQGITREVLAQEFSERVAALVAQESEDKSKTWLERNRQGLSGYGRRVVESFPNERKEHDWLVLQRIAGISARRI